MVKEVICTICPMGCHITVKGEGDNIESIEGYTCKLGLEHAKAEFSHPVRILTTTVKLDSETSPLLAVRSNKPVPKELLMDCMEEIKKVKVTPPVKRYDVIIKNICGCGADIVATGTCE